MSSPLLSSHSVQLTVKSETLEFGMLSFESATKSRWRSSWCMVDAVRVNAIDEKEGESALPWFSYLSNLYLSPVFAFASKSTCVSREFIVKNRGQKFTMGYLGSFGSLRNG